MKKLLYPIVIDLLPDDFLIMDRRGKFRMPDYAVKMCE